ncbi:MAG TPA: hypothetical protein VGF75_05225, partial [Candidatus Saccharimonadales bacterium]
MSEVLTVSEAIESYRDLLSQVEDVDQESARWLMAEAQADPYYSQVIETVMALDSLKSAVESL